jgi:hypothetical protein
MIGEARGKTSYAFFCAPFPAIRWRSLAKRQGAQQKAAPEERL